MDLKKFAKTTNSSLLIAIVIGILAVVNFFSYQIFHRFDLTQNQDFSISRTSKDTVGGLNDIVNIKVYFSDNLPAQYVGLKQEVGDILDEYANYSGSKVKLEFIDPKDDKALAQELSLAGIPQLQFNVLEKDKYQVVNGWLGMLIKYGDREQAIPVIDNTNNFEYQVTSAIKKVTAKELPVIGFWKDDGAADINQELSIAYKKLSELYDVRPVDFASDKQIDLNVKTLIIAGPSQKFTDAELKALDGFLTRGGSLMILADGVTVGNGLSAEKNDVGLNKILAGYGVKLNNNLVLDVSNGMASFSQGFLSFATNYPFWPRVINQGFDKNNASVAKLESLILPWASSIDVTNDNKDIVVSYLAKTTPNGWLVADNFNLNPQAISQKGGAVGQYNLAVALSGPFKSAFNQTSTAPGRLLVVGDSDFIRDKFLQNSQDNLLFFQNIVDSLSLDQDLIGIRSKGISERPIKDLSDGAKAAVRYGNIFGLTAIVVILGFVRYMMRRRNRFVDDF